MIDKIPFISPATSAQLIIQEDCLFSPTTGEKFPIINNIPRFVSEDNYASPFGLQWKAFRNTQLDSYTGTSISFDRLERISGGDINIFKGKTVLEAGCGAGRFTEILLKAGAQVWAVDLSSAIEANYDNCHHFPGYVVCQADINELPFAKNLFDIVVCIGVLQHTPDPEVTIRNLCSHLKHGGLIFLDHYTYGYPISKSRNILRKFLLKKNGFFTLKFVKVLVFFIWPFHLVLFKLRKCKFIRSLRPVLIKYSPIIDYQDVYPMLGDKLLREWAVLDTHDTLTDRYKFLKSADEIRKILHSCGMIEIYTGYAGNGVEASAQKRMTRE